MTEKRKMEVLEWLGVAIVVLAFVFIIAEPAPGGYFDGQHYVEFVLVKLLAVVAGWYGIQLAKANHIEED